MKSIIDWNELIPRLPKKMRDDIYLEAVAILSEDDSKEEPVHRKKSKGPGLRIWEEEGDGHHLAKAGRKYTINKKAKVKFNDGSDMERVFNLLRDSHNDTITYEGLVSIIHGVTKKSPQPITAYLWKRRLIDVVSS